MIEKWVEFYCVGVIFELFENFNYWMCNYCCNILVVVLIVDLESEVGWCEVVLLCQQFIMMLNQYYLFKYEWGFEDFINYFVFVFNLYCMLVGDYFWLFYDDGKEIWYQIVVFDI